MKPAVNNQFYDELGERWYSDDEHIIALLRAESQQKFHYILQALQQLPVPTRVSLLDVGCGAGFLTNRLAQSGYRIAGIDLSADSVATATRHKSPSISIDYRVGSAYALPFPNASFDAVLMMDILEHMDQPELAITEATRVLRKGGLLIFYTFNRTVLARILAIDAVALLAKDCPKHFHVWHLFIKPKELQAMLAKHGLRVDQFIGLRPDFLHWSFWSSVFRGRVHPKFSFKFTSKLSLGYFGTAIKV